MAIETVILKVRRGPYGEFITDKQKLSVGEPCAVLSGDPSVPSGKAFYVCFQAGDARRMVSIEDLEIMVQRGDFKGDPGNPGTPGRGIKDIEVNTQSHLIFTMTDNTKIDAGFILDILEQISASEQLRIQAEKSRVSAETARAAAEASRQTQPEVQRNRPGYRARTPENQMNLPGQRQKIHGRQMRQNAGLQNRPGYLTNLPGIHSGLALSQRPNKP